MVSVGFAGLPTAFAGCDANSEAVCYSNAFTSPTSPCYGTVSDHGVWFSGRCVLSDVRAGWWSSCYDVIVAGGDDDGGHCPCYPGYLKCLVGLGCPEQTVQQAINVRPLQHLPLIRLFSVTNCDAGSRLDCSTVRPAVVCLTRAFVDPAVCCCGPWRAGLHAASMLQGHGVQGRPGGCWLLLCAHQLLDASQRVMLSDVRVVLVVSSLVVG